MQNEALFIWVIMAHNGPFWFILAHYGYFWLNSVF